MPEIWQAVLGDIRGQVTPQQFETWFRPIRPSRLNAGAVDLTVPNIFTREGLTKNYASLIRSSVARVAGWDSPVITISVEGGVAAGEEGATRAFERVSAPAAPAPKAAALDGRGLNGGVFLNRDYTFDRFVVGPHNALAVAAGKAIVEHPGRMYNPLFVYGRVGLGKTHLLQAVCHDLLARRADTKLAYVSCEQFINQFISAVEKTELEAFRARFRRLDVLVIDDVHFLANKERSQEEFFHTFNALHQLDKQIILSSDSPPPEIPTLSERLVSRFRQGMVCQLDAPLFETRLQIARRKAEDLGKSLPDDVLDFIASNIQTNVRELEGAVVRVVGNSVLMNQPITLERTREFLSDMLYEKKKRVTLDDIVTVVTDDSGVRRAELQSKHRTKALTEPRQVCMYLARRLTPLSLEEIGAFFGGRDHTTVNYASERVAERCGADPEFRRRVERLASALGATLAP